MTATTSECILEAGPCRACAHVMDTFRLLESNFDPLYRRVHRYLVHCLFDVELADELTAATFCRASQYRARMPGELRGLEMWLLRMATNLVNSHLRRQRLHRLLLGRWTSLSHHEQAGTSSVDDDTASQVRAALQSLPAKCQAAVVLRYYCDMSYADIATTLQCREPAARARLSRGLAVLRDRLKLKSRNGE